MTTGGQPLGTARKVPVWRTAVESYRFLFANLGRFLALGWLLMVIAAAPQIVGVLAMGEPSGWGAETLQDSPAHVLATVLISVVYYAMYPVFAVRWHATFTNFARSRRWSDRI